jgi:hypothetical protein
MVPMDERELEAFREGLRRRYSDEEILTELRAAAERLGRSPTMREFGADPRTRVHPRTVIERFGSWNEAKRAAGLVPRRFATRDDLIAQLRALGEELGRTPSGRDLQARRGTMPSKSLYWHVFGSLANALREAGFDVPDEDERLERAIEHGARLARRLRRLPKFTDWAAARQSQPGLPSEWQVYRLVAARGRWSGFQFLVRERLAETGAEVAPDGRVTAPTARRQVPRSRRGARDTRRAPRVRARKGGAAR